MTLNVSDLRCVLRCCAVLQESVHFFRYNKTDNKLYCFADDVHPRYITAMTPLDYDTVAAGDKFGNFVVLRLPADVSAQVGGQARMLHFKVIQHAASSRWPASHL